MERPVDFFRSRHMLCGQCNHQWVVDLDWIARWEQALETCPGCGVDCQGEAPTRVTVDPDDCALVDENVAQLVWYHTSTQSDWPTHDFEPAAELTEVTRRRMGGDEAVARWEARQRAKALHVGTYEAAIHNMLRRIDDQAQFGSQFFLYRVRLVPTVTVQEGWRIDPSNFVGDVVLAEVCPPGIDVARYLNYHEDPGALSLALGRHAIASTQQISIPSPSCEDLGWRTTAIGELKTTAAASPPYTGTSPVGRRNAVSPRRQKAGELILPLMHRLPVNLQRQYQTAVAFDDNHEPEEWARYVVGLTCLILAPERALAELDRESLRTI